MSEQVTRDGTVLRVDRKTRRVITSITAAIVLGVATATVLSLEGIIRNRNPPAALVAIALSFVVGGGLMVVSISRARVVLHPDAIVIVRGLAPPRRLARADVAGRRLSPSAWHSPPHHVLITRDGAEVNLPPYIEHSRQLQAWLAETPLARTR